MSKEFLVAAVKDIVTRARSGDTEGSYDGYAALFSAPEFLDNRPEDQRRALELLILAKRTGPTSDKLIEAHRSAIEPLTQLVSAHHEPADLELLGLCQLVTGDAVAAAELFRDALTRERARDAGSTLCGRLMTRVSAL